MELVCTSPAHRGHVTPSGQRSPSSAVLPAYLDEIEWRFNNRAKPYLFRDTLEALSRAEPLEYKSLTARDATA